MKIDEALKDFKETKEILIEAKNNNKDEVFENIDKNISQCEIAIEALELMRWHREQDLIDRPTLLNDIKRQMPPRNGTVESIEHIIRRSDKAIPKAEPPKGVEWWNRSPSHEKFDYNEPLKTESMVSAERLIKDAGGSQ